VSRDPANSRIAGLVRSAEHDETLMAPKLRSKAQVMAENASADTVLAVAAQIGWLETCIPVMATQAVTDIELLLSSGSLQGVDTSSIAGVRGLRARPACDVGNPGRRHLRAAMQTWMAGLSGGRSGIATYRPFGKYLPNRRP
jgi:hypothetical protein